MLVHNLINLIVVGQLSLVVALLALSKPFKRANLLATALLTSVVAYLLMSNDGLAPWLTAVRPFLIGLSLLVPYLLWLFAIEIFEVDFSLQRFRGLILLVPMTIGAIFGIDMFLEWRSSASLAHRMISILLLIHLVWLILSGHREDLLDKRRRYRIVFVGLVALQTCAILVVELRYGNVPVPVELEMLNVIVIGLLIAALSLPLLRIDTDLVWYAAETPQPQDEQTGSAEQTASISAVREEALIHRLMELMEGGFFTTTSLTISQLADELDCTEHALRASINQRLGYRNFSAFLNQYRIAEAKNRLRDPALSAIPILSIALDLGYASIGPFNRAFKAETGMTPSAFRRERAENSG